MAGVLDRAQGMAQQICEWRRWFHQNPELSGQEQQTAAKLATLLAAMGLTVTSGVGGNGVVGLLCGQGPSTVALRADMDALPLQEETGLDYASCVPGVMHACGHDAHMAVVLGAAALLVDWPAPLPGNVKFIFQPSEETPPGGAQAMIRAGVLNDPAVEAIIGLHVNPYLPAGMVGLKEGVVMAAADHFKLLINGRGGHAASPHMTVDAIVVAAQVVQAMQTVVSRRIDPLEPAVVSIGTIRGGEKANIIAGQVEMTGTIRSLRDDLRRRLPEMLQQIISGVCTGYGAEFEWCWEDGFPPLVNDSRLLAEVADTCRQVVGTWRTLKLQQASMGGEDFAFFAQRIPAVYLHLGVGSGAGAVAPWHSNCFELEERALPDGAAVLAQAVVDILDAKRR